VLTWQVEIDLDLNAYANARAHYESRKAKAAKQQKTVEQNARALLAAEKTAQLKLTQVSSSHAKNMWLAIYPNAPHHFTPP